MFKSVLTEKLNPVDRFKEFFFGGPGAIVMAIAVSFFGIFKGQAGVVEMLRGWGPVFPISLVCIGVVGVYLGMQSDLARENARAQNELLSQSVEVQRETAAAYGGIANSLAKIAEKDDRDKQEMQTLVGVVNSKVEQTLDEQKRQNRALERIEDALKINRPKESDEQ